MIFAYCVVVAVSQESEVGAETVREGIGEIASCTEASYFSDISEFDFYYCCTQVHFGV
jgi:hypothetical protein